MTALTRDAAQIRYWKTKECIHEKDYIITFNDEEVDSEITLCTICNSPLTQTPNKTEADIVDEQINDLNSQTRELYENDRRLKGKIDSLNATLIRIQKSLVKEEAEDEKPMLYACNKCGNKTNGLNEYANCKTSFCDGVYRRISKDKKSETICQCDNCGDKVFSKSKNKLCFHCSRGVYKEEIE